MNLAFIALALGVGLWLKHFYSGAGFDDLRWVLAPTVWLVERLTGSDFVAEAQRGYYSAGLRYEIVPACAGVNFMIVAFWSLACGLMSTRRTVGARFAWIAASGFAAYAVTLLANATRITIAIALHRAGVSFGPLTPDRLHAAEGVAVYFLFLCVTFAIGTCVAGARRVAAI
ncbi:MAG TPA: exosortase K [Candidatus Eisenbacteria bacterium]|nr:exosortase K [Candidatus Eisenbacteria bacterium]